MKKAVAFCLVSLCSNLFTNGESRIFTNKEGKKVKAELVALEGNHAVVVLTNAKRAKVPMESLSESDQEFVRSWWEENKDNFNQMDVTLSIDRNRKQLTKSGGNNNQRNANATKKKISTEEIQFACEIKSFTKRDISNLSVDYTIYKRVISRGEEGSDTTVEEIDGTAPIKKLEGHRSATFDSQAVVCEDSSQRGGKGPRLSKRETIIGFVVTLSADGKEFFKQSHPENFIERLKEEEERDDD
ncbi:MAG: hypothetical protein AB8D78_02620 [Akkermansiaceae bacterium]